MKNIREIFAFQVNDLITRILGRNTYVQAVAEYSLKLFTNFGAESNKSALLHAKICLKTGDNCYAYFMTHEQLFCYEVKLINNSVSTFYGNR